MIESLITVLFVGLFAGFIFSVPVAGPLSILITSNVLKGEIKLSRRIAIGGSIGEFFYVFIGVFGIASLYNLYKSAVPYILIFGSLFLLYIGITVWRTKIDLGDFSKQVNDRQNVKRGGGIKTGFFVNISNPSLFIGWLSSSFLLLSFVSSLGLNVGELDLLVGENVSSISGMSGREIIDADLLQKDYGKVNERRESADSTILSSLYATAVSVGSFIWFYFFSFLLGRYRDKIKSKYVQIIIKLLGVLLIMISLYLIFTAVSLLSGTL